MTKKRERRKQMKRKRIEREKLNAEKAAKLAKTLRGDSSYESKIITGSGILSVSNGGWGPSKIAPECLGIMGGPGVRIVNGNLIELDYQFIEDLVNKRVEEALAKVSK